MTEPRSAATSGAQDELWLRHRLSPQSPVDNLCRAYLITGRLDLAALRTAWLAVTARHPVLQTTFTEVRGCPVARIGAGPGHPPVVVDAGATGPAGPVVDAGTTGPAGREAAANRLCAGWAATPFDLAEGPLARLFVARLDETHHRLVLVAHAAVADERSMSVLAGDLSVAYRRGALPEPALRYADFVRWQRAHEAGPQVHRLLDWWTATLAPPPPPLTLPVDCDRTAEPSTDGAALRFEWSGPAGAPLAALCETAGTTPYVALLAAFECLLGRYGGEDRVAVGIPVTLRTRPAFHTVVGPFGNLLVHCADLSDRPTFRELLARTARTLRAAGEHRHLPFHRLVQALNPARDPGRIPWCDALFVLPGGPAAVLGVAGAVVEPVPIDSGTVQADLTLTVDRERPSLAGSLAYRRSLFGSAAAASVLRQLRTLLAAAVTRPDVPVATLALDDQDRTRAMLRAADRVAAATIATEPVHETVRRHAEQRPDATAVAGGGTEVSYRDLDREAALVSGWLRRYGAVSGCPVAVRMAPGPHQLAASLGVLDADGHLVWFGAGDAGERGRAVLADLRPALLLLDHPPAGDELARWYAARRYGAVLDVTAIGPARDAVPWRAEPAPAPAGGDERLAYVAYTSGSTGRPKGIPQTHGAFAQFVTWLAGAFGIGPGSRVAQWVAAEHDPSLCEVFATLVGGGTLVPVPDRIRVHPERLVDWLVAERITFLQTVPSFARELLKVIADQGAAPRLASLDRLALMGEALPADLVNGLRAALPAVRLSNMYGPTETIAATWYDITGPVPGTVPIGHAIPGRDVLVLDDEDRPCPIGVTGELVIRSPYVTPGYAGAGGASGTAFRPVPGYHDGVACYRTGDLARRRWDGLLEFRGRRDFQVKLLGNRVELTDVEAALAAHESVAETAVVALSDADGLVTQLVAYVVPHPTPPGVAAASAGTWRAHLRRRFGAALPVSFYVLGDRLPRNVAGKVDRGRLPNPQAVLTRSVRPPQTRVERELAAIWSALLGGGPHGTGPVGADDSFFAAGGHSLLVPQLASRVRERFGVEIPLREYFANPTLAGMSTLVDAAGRHDAGDPTARSASLQHRPRALPTEATMG